jgi:hypothetical protein
MTSKKDAGKSLVDFMKDVRMPERLITDGATEFTGRHTELITEAKCDLCASSCYMRWKKDARMRIMRRNRDENFESEMTLNYKQVVVQSLHPGMRPRRRKSWKRVRMMRRPTAGRRRHEESAHERRS